MADVELRPLPWSDVQPNGRRWLFNPEDRPRVEDYARANMEPLIAEIEALRAEVERLQEIVRPRREDECLTLDHWRMRAYDLEANWSRCSRACAGEQTKREQAEARAERLAEALREAKETMLSQVKWEACDCGCPQGRKPTDAVSVTWLRAVQQVEIATARAEEWE